MIEIQTRRRRSSASWWPAVVLGSLIAVGCSSGGSTGGGGSGSNDDLPGGDEFVQRGSDVPESDAEAARFLAQAAMGATLEDIQRVRTIGYYGWFDEQIRANPTLHRPWLDAREARSEPVYQNHRMESWYRASVHGVDQFRQRVAWSLSQVLVISDEDVLGNSPQMMADYYDMLVREGLGNYRDLIESVSKHPAMGRYLSHLGNRKANPSRNTKPDENYAREIMQLFTIGLVELNLDGTPRLDGNGKPIETYTQTDIEELARVFTGWDWAGGQNGSIAPMEPDEGDHDTDAKTVLGTVIPAGLTTQQDLDAALDLLFQHPNVGPFLAYRLIQRLVTSNPAPAYVAAVARVFNDNGQGVRGDLSATVRAVLMHRDARTGHRSDTVRFGKLKEPMLRQTQLYRAFGAFDNIGNTFRIWNPDRDFNQAPLRSPTVFNFYQPTDVAPGMLADAGLVAPETRITTYHTITTTTNEFGDVAFGEHNFRSGLADNRVRIRIDRERALATDPGALVDHLALLLMEGAMPAAMRSTIVSYLEAETDLDDGGTDRVEEALYLVLTSPEAAVLQ